ncbi:MAG: fumarylacetoacetate hydrolase family protein [Pollutimonas bauzanensis]|uniref:2-keto-4-pentenoate hydratase/2-oxohepta-3-ene-1,7-dioic acid hydratase (Catechol pathway) n=1 Tax=Pollutimonas bauzanensis TaxID=658167 RepID=A0A1M5YNS8_9BURK|nr:fumarylacetoacetate hydrolase family protein [Pollutimonas bauzanensis]SHI13551.1 2-keto-4-pentenoate hydratase/2-oxohepta-3-ene-1,7-dioic acid hydratase (catechol pathway) [Pollutimonas bauzanensis]
MKLCQFGDANMEKAGVIDAEGRLRDLSSVVDTIEPRDLSPRGLARLASINPSDLPVVSGEPRLGIPFRGTSKIVCIGLNYSDHAEEAGLAVPAEPIIFLKPTTALCGPYDNVVQPRHSTRLDWEVELGVVIGSKAQYVPKESALDFVAGYCVVNDVSERAFQMQSSQWDKGKGCDTFAPVGPWLVTTDELQDPQNLDMWLDVNGVRMQHGKTSTMIFDIATLISYCSEYLTLLPGDIIATGTPPGVGMGKTPDPVWLQAGDIVTLGIEGLGRQRQRIVRWPDKTM